MECCERTEADKKGGHLGKRSSDGQLILRESAQCAKEDSDSFQNVGLHRFFNTNNLWVRLDMLKQLMDVKGGFVPLPTILNSKTVDPQLESSEAVFQLEVSVAVLHNGSNARGIITFVFAHHLRLPWVLPLSAFLEPGPCACLAPASPP